MNGNFETVRAAYSAFGHGDIRTVLDLLLPDADWIIAGQTETIPYAGHHKGHKGVGDYFAALQKVEDVRMFDAQEFFGDGNSVIVQGHYRGHVKSTQQEYQYDWVHVFTLADGKIARFRQYCDTAAVVDAYTVK